MAENPKVCYICDQNHINKPSTDWCSECEQAFCQDCMKFHGSSKLSKNHSTLPIGDYLALDDSLSDIRGYCSNHEEFYQLFCPTHDVPLCLSCLEDHQECKTVIPLSKMTKNIKTSESYQDAQKNLDDVEATITKFQDHLRQNLSQVDKQEETILTDIKDARRQINEHLDKIEKALENELSNSTTTCKTGIESALKALDEKKNEVEKYKQQMNNMHNFGSEFQTFFGVRQVVSNLKPCEQFLEATIAGDGLDIIKIKCPLDGIVDNIVGKVPKFGSVQIERTRCDIQIQKTKHKQAQLIGGKSILFNDIKVNLIKKFTIVSTDTTGCCVLPDGKMVLVDYDDRDCIDVYGSDGRHSFTISMSPHYAFDVTPIDEDRVAVSSAEKENVIIVNVKNRTIDKCIDTNYMSLGIRFNKGSLICGMQAEGIVSIDPEAEHGRLMNTLVKCDLSAYSYVDSVEDKMYYTDYESNSVICCDLDGNRIWTHDDVAINKPHGLSVDDNGNVFVACYGNNSIYVISSDGQHSRKLLSGDDELNYPTAVYFDSKRNTLLVANQQQRAFLYEFM